MEPITFVLVIAILAVILAVLDNLSADFGADSRGWEDRRPWWPGDGQLQD